MSEVKTGRLKFFSAPKGYGFVVPDDGGADVLVHAKILSGEDKLRMSIAANKLAAVRYVAALRDRGMVATMCVLVDGAALPAHCPTCGKAVA